MALENLGWQYLSEDICPVQVSVDVHWFDDVLVAERDDPLLATVDVLQLGASTCAARPDLRSFVIDFQMKRPCSASTQELHCTQ